MRIELELVRSVAKTFQSDKSRQKLTDISNHFL